ncbi:MAG: hypothetical protein IID35_10815 [Planctomycetes bacterium]|nr:hypothetical protein [Planctomycetota bacterium]
MLHAAQSLFHDGATANRLGIAFAWINRYNDPYDGGVEMVSLFADLESLANAVCGHQ